MTKHTIKSYPSAALENNGLEQRLEKKINEVNSFDNSITDINEKPTYYKEKDHKSATKNEKHRTLTSIIDSVDTVVSTRALTSCATLSVTAVGIILVPISAGVSFALSLGNKGLHKMNIHKYRKNLRNQIEKGQQTAKSFKKLYKKSSQDDLLDHIEYESLCNTILLINTVMKRLIL